MIGRKSIANFTVGGQIMSSQRSRAYATSVAILLNVHQSLQSGLPDAIGIVGGWVEAEAAGVQGKPTAESNLDPSSLIRNLVRARLLRNPVRAGLRARPRPRYARLLGVSSAISSSK